MIGFLSGKLQIIDGPRWIIDCRGVGYVVWPSPHLRTEHRLGENLEVYIYTQVKEDAINLFGFASLAELHLFEKLISVSGIGPKLAMNIFSSGDVNQIVGAISKGEVAFFTSVSGIGKKNAQRVIIELKSKVGGDGEFELTDSTDRDEAVQALESLGFSASEAYQTLKTVDGNLPVSTQVKLALKSLNK